MYRPTERAQTSVPVVPLPGVVLVCVVVHLLPGALCNTGKQVGQSGNIRVYLDLLSCVLVFQVEQGPGCPVDTLAVLLSDILRLPHPASCGNLETVGPHTIATAAHSDCISLFPDNDSGSGCFPLVQGKGRFS